MRMLSLLTLAVLACSSPVLAAQNDGAKAEDARRVMAQSCSMPARYHPGCLGWMEPATTASTVAPAPAPTRSPAPRR